MEWPKVKFDAEYWSGMYDRFTRVCREMSPAVPLERPAAMGDPQDRNPQDPNPKMAAKARILQAKQHDTSLRLIEAVRARPILYNSKRVEYRNIELKTNAWIEVRQQTRMPSVEACQKLWKTLRDRFIRELRVTENTQNPGEMEAAAQANMTPWPYFDRLLFYKDCGRAPRTYTRAVRKQRSSVVSTSSGDESRDNSANAHALYSTSTSSSPILAHASSTSNLASTSRDSSSNTAGTSSQEAPARIGFQHEPSTSAFKETVASRLGRELKTEPSENTPSTSSITPGIPPEHKAFLDAVMNKASRRDSEASRYASERTPLRELPPNAPFRTEKEPDGEAAWEAMEVAVSANAQSSNDENQCLAGIVQEPGCSRSGLERPQTREQALDLSRDFSAFRATGKLVHVPKARLAGPSTFMPLRAPLVSSSVDSSELSSMMQRAKRESSTSSLERPESPENLHVAVASRKRKTVIEQCPSKRIRMDDEDTLFALALVPSLKRLSARQKSALKAKIMQSFADAECGTPDRSE